MTKNDLTHIDEQGNPRMVDVSGKKISRRTAMAQCKVILGKEITDLLHNKEIVTKKGPVFQTAIIAGTQAVKRTGLIIPFCHPLPIDSINFQIEPDSEEAITITCSVSVEARTGVEMEAITGATIAGVTVYDMCKGISHNIEIGPTRLMEKTGGKKNFKRTV